MVNKGKIVSYVISDSGGWILLFVDSKLFAQGDEISANDWIDLINTVDNIKEVRKYSISDEALDNWNSEMLDYQLKMDLEQIN